MSDEFRHFVFRLPFMVSEYVTEDGVRRLQDVVLRRHMDIQVHARDVEDAVRQVQEAVANALTPIPPSLDADWNPGPV